MGCHELPFERVRIEILKESGCSLRDIAKRIGRSAFCCTQSIATFI
ncbi:helix-turn-helix domain-containing protein [Domibacillus sp. DTU_2020_1001157_1_SI_ALB_TIR_016]